MLSSTFIAPPVYNTLPMIEQQTLLTETELRALGGSFTQHQVERLFKVSLVHKHFMLGQGTFMVHTAPGLKA